MKGDIDSTEIYTGNEGRRPDAGNGPPLAVGTDGLIPGFDGLRVPHRDRHGRLAPSRGTQRCPPVGVRAPSQEAKVAPAAAQLSLAAPLREMAEVPIPSPFLPYKNFGNALGATY
jgi:hypothetical protein